MEPISFFFFLAATFAIMLAELRSLGDHCL